MTEEMNNWQPNSFSIEYIKSRKKTRIIPLLLLLLGLALTLFIKNFFGQIIFLSIVIAVSALAFISQRSGDNKLPIKVKFSNGGIHYVLKKGETGFIHWEDMHSLTPIDNKFKDYILLYKGREKIHAYKHLGYTELALGHVIAPEALRQFEKYSSKENKFS